MGLGRLVVDVVVVVGSSVVVGLGAVVVDVVVVVVGGSRSFRFRRRVPSSNVVSLS